MKERKKDHIELAFQSRTEKSEANLNFCYEPLLSAHPQGQLSPFEFAGKTMKLPIWISSMTGGTEKAGAINRNLAKACRQFGLGMGLGSCRVLLEKPELIDDFNIRSLLGNEQPLYANLGISQLEKLIISNELHKINKLVDRLQADGIIIHVNPLQEAFQPEGDRFNQPPIDTIEQFLNKTQLRVIVKEVGQGMGPESLERLLKLPLEAIEFGAFGGTNFALLELHRQNEIFSDTMRPFTKVGHSALEMTGFANNFIHHGGIPACKQLIISGGITSVLDGYHLVKSSPLPAVFGMGSMFLKYAYEGYTQLETYIKHLQQGWLLADSYLKINQMGTAE